MPTYYEPWMHQTYHANKKTIIKHKYPCEPFEHTKSQALHKTPHTLKVEQ
jgi:hypothetical protein